MCNQIINTCRIFFIKLPIPGWKEGSSRRYWRLISLLLPAYHIGLAPIRAPSLLEGQGWGPAEGVSSHLTRTVTSSRLVGVASSLTSYPTRSALTRCLSLLPLSSCSRGTNIHCGALNPTWLVSWRFDKFWVWHLPLVIVVVLTVRRTTIYKLNLCIPRLVITSHWVTHWFPE